MATARAKVRKKSRSLKKKSKLSLRWEPRTCDLKLMISQLIVRSKRMLSLLGSPMMRKAKA